MWAQLITMRIKPGMAQSFISVIEQLNAIEQPDSGLVRQIALQDQKDPNKYFMLAIFESEEKARKRENDPRRAEGLEAIRSTMVEMVDGLREFVDVNVIADIAQ